MSTENNVPRIEFYQYSAEYNLRQSSPKGFKKRQKGNNKRYMYNETNNNSSYMTYCIDPLIGESNSSNMNNINNIIKSNMNMNSFYKLYKIFVPKEQDFRPKGIYSNIKDNYLNIIKQATGKNKSYIENNINNINNIHHFDALIYKINVNPTEKIIVFGDFHGSFHTFLRHLFRLHLFGVINLSTYTINKGYKIIFLGKEYGK